MRLIDDVRQLDMSSLRRVVSLDVETTGLDPLQDKILEIALAYSDGRQTFRALVNPTRHRSWEDSERVTGIKPHDVEGERTIGQLTPQVEKCLNGVDLIVGYNIPFDLKFLRQSGILLPSCDAFDVMRAFAKVIGKGRGRRYRRWARLEQCCRYYGVPLRPHNAQSDAEATLSCFAKMIGFQID